MSVRRSGNFTHETQVMQALMFICMNFRMTVELSLLRVSIVALCALEQLAGMPALMERQVISVLRGEVILGASEGPKSPQIGMKYKVAFLHFAFCGRKHTKASF